MIAVVHTTPLVDKTVILNLLYLIHLAVAYWLGGSDWDNEGEWKWEPHAIPFNFSDWQRGQPNNGGNNEHCLSVHRLHHYEFTDDNCHYSQHYLCEKPYVLIMCYITTI